MLVMEGIMIPLERLHKDVTEMDRIRMEVTGLWFKIDAE